MRKTNYGQILRYFYYISIGIFLLVGIISYFYSQQVSADEFSSKNLNEFIQNFYPWALSVSGGLAIVVLIFSGYLYITSAGNIEQVNKAKEYIFGALSGLAFLILAAMIYAAIKI